MEPTGNYFTDLETARLIGIVEPGKNPKKKELAQIIADYNQAQSIDKVDQSPAIIDELISNVAESDEADELALIECAMPILNVDLDSVDFSEVDQQFADRQTAKSEARSAKSQTKAQPIAVEWDDASEALKVAFNATKDRLERSRIIYKLAEKHASKIVAEKLDRTIAKIRSESKAYQYWLDDEKLQNAVARGMGWSKLIDNISNYKKALSSYLNPINIVDK